MGDISEFLLGIIGSQERNRKQYIAMRAAKDRDKSSLKDFEKSYVKSFGRAGLKEAAKEYNQRRVAGKVGKRVYETGGLFSGGGNLSALGKLADENWKQHLGEGVQRAAVEDGRELEDQGFLGRRATDFARGTQSAIDNVKSVAHNVASSITGDTEAYDEVEQRRQLLAQGRAADPTVDEASQIKGFGDLFSKIGGGAADLVTGDFAGAYQKWGGVAEAGASGLAQQAPTLIGSAVMRDPKAFLAYWTAQMQPDARADFIDEGFSREWANSLGWLSGFVQAQIEAQVKIEHGAVAQKGFWRAAAGEFAEEFQQSAVHETMMAIAKAGSGGSYDVKRRIYEDMNRELANALVVVPMLTGAGHGASVAPKLWGNALVLASKASGGIDINDITNKRLIAGLIASNVAKGRSADIEAAIESPTRRNLSRIGVTGEIDSLDVTLREQFVSDALSVGWEQHQKNELEGEIARNAENAALTESIDDIDAAADAIKPDQEIVGERDENAEELALGPQIDPAAATEVVGPLDENAEENALADPDDYSDLHELADHLEAQLDARKADKAPAVAEPKAKAKKPAKRMTPKQREKHRERKKREKASARAKAAKEQAKIRQQEAKVAEAARRADPEGIVARMHAKPSRYNVNKELTGLNKSQLKAVARVLGLKGYSSLPPDKLRKMVAKAGRALKDAPAPAKAEAAPAAAEPTPLAAMGWAGPRDPRAKPEKARPASRKKPATRPMPSQGQGVFQELEGKRKEKVKGKKKPKAEAVESPSRTDSRLKGWASRSAQGQGVYREREKIKGKKPRPTYTEANLVKKDQAALYAIADEKYKREEMDLPRSEQPKGAWKPHWLVNFILDREPYKSEAPAKAKPKPKAKKPKAKKKAEPAKTEPAPEAEAAQSSAWVAADKAFEGLLNQQEENGKLKGERLKERIKRIHSELEPDVQVEFATILSTTQGYMGVGKALLKAKGKKAKVDLDELAIRLKQVDPEEAGALISKSRLNKDQTYWVAEKLGLKSVRSKTKGNVEKLMVEKLRLDKEREEEDAKEEEFDSERERLDARHIEMADLANSQPGNYLTNVVKLLERDRAEALVAYRTWKDAPPEGKEAAQAAMEKLHLSEEGGSWYFGNWRSGLPEDLDSMSVKKDEGAPLIAPDSQEIYSELAKFAGTKMSWGANVDALEREDFDLKTDKPIYRKALRRAHAKWIAVRDDPALTEEDRTYELEYEVNDLNKLGAKQLEGEWVWEDEDGTEYTLDSTKPDQLEKTRTTLKVKQAPKPPALEVKAPKPKPVKAAVKDELNDWEPPSDDVIIEDPKDPRLTEFLQSKAFDRIAASVARSAWMGKEPMSEGVDIKQAVSTKILEKLAKDPDFKLNLKTANRYVSKSSKFEVINHFRKGGKTRTGSLPADATIAQERVEGTAIENFLVDSSMTKAERAKARLREEFKEDPHLLALWDLAAPYQGKSPSKNGRVYRPGLLTDVKALKKSNPEYADAFKKPRGKKAKPGDFAGLNKPKVVDLLEFMSKVYRDIVKEELREDIEHESRGELADSKAARAAYLADLKEMGVKPVSDAKMLDGIVRSNSIVEGLEYVWNLNKNMLRLSTIIEKTKVKNAKGEEVIVWTEGAAGLFRTLGGGIELAQKAWSNVSVAVHELAHMISKKYKPLESAPKKIVDQLGYLDYDPKKRRAEEGFAEAVRKWVQGDQEFLEEWKDDLVPWLEDFVTNQVSKKDAKAFAQTQRAVQNWRKLSRTQEMTQRIGTTTDPSVIRTKSERARTWFGQKLEDIKTKWIDSNMPIWNFYVEREMLPESKGDARATGYEVHSANGHGGAIQRMQRAISEGVTNLAGKVIGPSLDQVIDGMTEKVAALFESFMISKHIIAESKRELKKGEKRARYAWTAEEAQECLDELAEMGHDLDDWTRRHTLFVEMSNKTLLAGVEAGAFNEKSVQNIIDKYGNTYVPMNALYKKGTLGLSHRQGHLMDIRSPLVVLIERMSYRYAAAFRAEAMTAFVKDFDPLEGGKEGSDGVIRRLKEGQKTGRPEDTIGVYLRREDGTQELVKYEVNPELRAALDWVPTEAQGMMLQAIKRGNDIFKLGATGASIAFAVANVVRDMQTSAVQSRYQTLGQTAGQAAITGALIMPLTTIPAVVTLATYHAVRESAKARWAPKWIKDIGEKLVSPIDKAMEQMGVGIKQELDMRSGRAVTNIRSAGDKSFGWGTPWRAVKGSANYLIDMIAAGDMIPRHAEVKAWLDKEQGISVRNGVFVDKHTGEQVELTRSQLIKLKNVADNATTNFSRAGRHGRNFNKYAAFVNAAIQSNVRIGETIFEDLRGKRGTAVRNRVAVRLGLFTTASLLYALFVLGDGDEEEEEYTDLDDYSKSKYWMLPNTGIRIPKSQDWAAITNAIEAMVSAARNKEMDPGKRLAFQTAWNAAPPFWPAIAGPALESYANRDDYTGRAIVPEQLMKKAKHEQVDARTTVMGKHLSAWMGWPLGKSQESKPYRPSPMGVDHYMDGMTANYWSAINDAFTNPEDKGTIESAVGLARKPFVAREATRIPTEYRQWEDGLREVTMSAEHQANPDMKIEAKSARARFTTSVASAIWKVYRKQTKRADKDKWLRRASGLYKWAMDRESKRLPNPLDPDAPPEVKAVIDPVLAIKVKALGKVGKDEDYPKEAEVLRGLRLDRSRIDELLRMKMTWRSGDHVGKPKPYHRWTRTERMNHGKRINRIMRRLRKVND